MQESAKGLCKEALLAKFQEFAAQLGAKTITNTA